MVFYLGHRKLTHAEARANVRPKEASHVSHRKGFICPLTLADTRDTEHTSNSDSTGVWLSRSTCHCKDREAIFLTDTPDACDSRWLQPSCPVLTP